MLVAVKQYHQPKHVLCWEVLTTVNSWLDADVKNIVYNYQQQLANTV